MRGFTRIKSAILLAAWWVCVMSCGGGAGETGADAPAVPDVCATDIRGDGRNADAAADDPPGETRTPEAPLDPCAAVCAGLECGEVDGCDCGVCEEPLACHPIDHLCQCVPRCWDPETKEPYECGDDGCGGECGAPDACPWDCKDHHCPYACVPVGCEGKECGSDGCGGSCGKCEPGCMCGMDGQCCCCCDFESLIGFVGPVQKVVTLAQGQGGHPGEALDLDGNPDTCAPAGNCEDGLDNQASDNGMALEPWSPDGQWAEMLDSGEWVLLLETWSAFKDDCEATKIMIWPGVPVADKSACDFQLESCEYYALPDAVDLAACQPQFVLDNAKVCDGKLTAGGPEYLMTVPLPAPEGIQFVVTLNSVQIAGDVTVEGDTVTISNGLIGGAIRKDKLLEWVDNLPEEMAAELPVDKETMKELIAAAVVVDMDTDFDGEADAVSFAVKFSTIPGAIVGFAPERGI